MSGNDAGLTQAPAGYRCLVIGPIGSHLAPIGSPEHTVYVESMERFGTVIEPACQAHGFKPIRADGMRTPGDIPDQVYRAIRDWELVIADLTDANPNVMYELALRHMTGKCAIAIGVYSRLPFDVGQIRTEQFVQASEAGLLAGRKVLTATIDAVLSTGCDELPVWRVFTRDAVQADVSQIIEGPPREVAAEPDAEGSDEEEPPGLLEILVETEDALPSMTAALEAIGAVVKQVGDLSARGTTELKAAQASKVKPAQASLVAVARAADALQTPASELDTLVAGYERDIMRLDHANAFLLDRLEEEPDGIKNADAYLRGLVKMGRASADNAQSSLDLARSMDNLGKGSRALRGPTSRVAAGVRRVRELGIVIEGWAARAEHLLTLAGLPVDEPVRQPTRKRPSTKPKPARARPKA